MVSLSKSDTEAMLAKTATPALVIMGTKDADFSDPAGEAKWVTDRIGAELLTAEGAGHYPQTEMAEQVGPAIVRFLQTGKP